MTDDPKRASEEEVRSEIQGRTSPSRTTRAQIIESAKKFNIKVESLIQALEDFYCNGFADEVSGDVDCDTGHFYRVDRWIVTTDSQGFHDIWSFNDIPEARREFQRLEKEYAEWMGDED
jgi:hypothetical protein